MLIRKATIDDIDLLIKLRMDYLREEMGKIQNDKEIIIYRQLPGYFKEHLINGTFIAVLAENRNEIASTAYLSISQMPANLSFIDGKVGTILNVLTYPQYRRQGIATNVLKHLLDEAKTIGVNSIKLSATKDGKEVYSKLGFSVSPYTNMFLNL